MQQISAWNDLARQPAIREDILGWIEKIEPYAMKLGYIPQMDVLHGICAKGSSSARQRAVFARNHSLREVTEFNMLEFKTRCPLWEKALGHAALPIAF